MIMIKSAFERLLDIDPDANKFSKALDNLLSPFRSTESERAPPSGEWLKKWPASQNILDAWARDFCAVRGAAAHGNHRAKIQSVWPRAAHLAFTSILFPLALKIQAMNSGMHSLTDEDFARISALEQYLAHNPSDALALDVAPAKHPWLAVDEKIALTSITRTLWPNLE